MALLAPPVGYATRMSYFLLQVSRMHARVQRLSHRSSNGCLDAQTYAYALFTLVAQLFIFNCQ
jgi:hypothetical protein